MTLDPYMRKTAPRRTCRVAPIEQRGTISTADAETTPSSPRMPRTKVDPPSSSPAPIRESQPRLDGPTATEHGTQPYHALYDTPPEGTQPIELKRSERSRAKSARGRDARTTKANRWPPSLTLRQLNPKRRTSSPTPRPPPEQPGLSARREELSAEPSTSTRIEREAQTPEEAQLGLEAPPGRGKIARASQATDQRVVLEPDAARELGDLIGINVSTATPAALKDTLQTLSNPHTLQVGPSKRYPQVRDQATAALPSLNKKVTYHRERLRELAHPRPSESPNIDTRPAKRPCTETRGKSTDEEMLDPDADMPEPKSPGLPRIPPLHSSQPLPSTSSTQRAIVNAFASQRDLPRATSGPDFRPTPVPQTKGSFTRLAPGLRYPSSDPRPPSPEHHQPSLDSRSPSPDPRPFSPEAQPFSPDTRPLSPNPRASSPDPLHANVSSWANHQPYDTSLTPELTRARPTLTTRSTAPSASGRKPPPDPNSATESETESEPQLKPKPRRRRRSKKKTPIGNESPEPASQPSDQRRQHPAHERDAQDVSSTQRRDAYDVLVRLNKLLDDETGPNDKEIDSLLRWAADLTVRRQPGQHPSSHAQAGPSSSHAQAGPSSSRTQPSPSSLHTQPGPLSSCTQPGPRSSHARPGPVPYHGRRRPAHDTNLSDDNSEGGAGAGEETDVEATDADDIVIRISNLRTEVKKRIRMVIRYLFGFVMGLSEEVMSANRHFLIRDEDHIDNLIEEGLPLPAVAFVLTMMQECIQEWQTGYFKPRDLNVSTQRSIFDAHLQGLIEYRRPARKRLAKFQVDWFSAGMEYAGIEINHYEDQDHYCQSITRSANVRPDTPEESEPEHDETGRLTARSKGKHKAR
ncbi:hypothetical protein FRC08_004190 [Ceratobasidium sp. 394]|nr:hypothetical protein FRC08_004190 [Ceratobasidium sp. 394]